MFMYRRNCYEYEIILRLEMLPILRYSIFVQSWLPSCIYRYPPSKRQIPVCLKDVLTMMTKKYLVLILVTPHVKVSGPNLQRKHLVERRAWQKWIALLR